METMSAINEEAGQHRPTCQICYEATDALLVLSSCNHSSCKQCLRKYLEREEVSGQCPSTSCPYCRVVICEKDILKILGRPFQQRARCTNTDEPNEQDMDDLTRHWLVANTKIREGCGFRVQKSIGCNYIVCLCGWRFCFGCGSPGQHCSCRRTQVRAGIGYVEPPVRINGHIDFRCCNLRRRVRPQRKALSERISMEETERWKYTTPGKAASCPSNGRWLFVSTKNMNSVRVLAQQLYFDKIRTCREPAKHAAVRTRLERENEQAYNKSMDLSWLFPGQHGWWDYEVQVRVQTARNKARKEGRLEYKLRWVYSEKKASTCTANGRWLFSSRKKSSCVEMLKQQLNCRAVRQKRRKQKPTIEKRQRMKWKTRASVCTWNGRWLFCTSGNSVRMLTQQTLSTVTRNARQSTRTLAEAEVIPSGTVNLSWILTQNESEGMRILQNFNYKDNVARLRRQRVNSERKRLKCERELKVATYLEGVMADIESRLNIPQG